MNDAEYTPPASGLVRMFRKEGVMPSARVLARDAVFCVLFAVAGLAIGVGEDEWWGFAGAAFFALAAAVLTREWWRARSDGAST